MSVGLTRILCAALIRAGGAFVPPEEQAEWMAEWDAEVASRRETDSIIEALCLIRRCFGAIVDGISLGWLRSSSGLTSDMLAAAVRESARAPWRLGAAVVGATISLAVVATLLAWFGEEWIPGESRTTGLVVLHNRWEAGRGSSFFPFSVPEFETLRAHSVTLPSIGAYSQRTTRWTSPEGKSRAASLAQASANLFDVAGMRMMRGRAFTAADEAPEAPRIVVLGSEFWRLHLDADRRVLGRTAVVAGEPCVIVGVAEDPPAILPRVDLWVPLPRDQAHPGPPNARNLGLVGRLRSGVDVPAARREVATLLSGIAIPGGADPPESFDRIEVEPWGAQRRERDLVRCAVLMGAVLGLVLVARCTVHAASSGSQALRLARAITILLPSLAGAMCLARFAHNSSASWLDAPPPSAGVTACSLLAAGALLLVDATRGTNSTRQAMRDRRGALVFGGALVFIAGVFFLRASAPALRATGLPSEEISLVNLRFDVRDPVRVAELSQRLLDRIAKLPGVEAVGLGSAAPFGRVAGSVSVSAAEQIEAGPPDVNPTCLHEADYHFVDPNFFDALSIPVRGRSRLGPGEIIVNETLARSLGIDESEMGRSLRIPARERLFAVVGIAPDLVVRDPTAAMASEVFFPLGGTSGSSVPVPTWGTLWIRTAGERDGERARAMRGALAELERDVTASSEWRVRDARWAELMRRVDQMALGLLTLGLGLSLGFLGRGIPCPTASIQ